MPSPAPPARPPIPPATADDDRPADAPARPPRTPNASPLRREPAAPSPSAAPTAPASASASAAAAPPEAPPAPAEAEAAAPTPPRPVCTRIRNIRIPEGGEVSWMELRKIVPDEAAGVEECREGGKEGGREEGGEVGEGGGGARRRVESRNQFQQMLQDIQRKYATERTVEARLQKKRPRAAACGEEAEGEEAAGGEERARGEEREEAEGEEAEGEDEGSPSRGSWYDVNDGFIDDSELLDEMGADDDGDSDSSGEAVLKSDGFFISRGALHSEAQLREQTERYAAPPPPPAKRQRSEGAAGRSSVQWDALCAIARMVGEEAGGGGGGGGAEAAAAFERLLAQCTDAGKRRKINLKQMRVAIEEQLGFTLPQVVTIRRLVAALSRRASPEEMARLLPLPGAEAPSAPPPPPAAAAAAAAPPPPPLLPAADAAPAAAPPPAAASTPPRPPPAAAGETLPSPSAGGGEAAGGEAEGGGAVGAEEAAEVLAKAGEQIDAALEVLRTKVGDDPKFKDVSISDASSKKLRLPPELASVLSLLARWAQLRVYAQHAAAKTAAPTSADGTLLPSSWLDKQLLASVSAVLPLAKDSLRNRLRGLGEKTALPEQVEELRRRLGARLRAFHEAVQPVLLPLRAEYDELRAAKRTAAKQRAAELLAALPSQPEALVGEKIEVRAEGKWRVVKAVRHVGPGALFEVQDGAADDMHGANTESLRLEENKWRRRDEPPPQPKFHWTAGLDAMLLEMGEMQLTIGKKKQEYLKLELPRELAGRHSSIYTAASDEKTPHPPELDELFAEAQKAFPSKVWMTAEKLRLRFFLLRKQKAEKAKEASESTPHPQAPPTPGEAEQKQQHTLESCPRTPSSCPGPEEPGSSQTIPDPPKNAE